MLSKTTTASALRVRRLRVRIELYGCTTTSLWLCAGFRRWHWGWETEQKTRWRNGKKFGKIEKQSRHSRGTKLAQRRNKFGNRKILFSNEGQDTKREHNRCYHVSFCQRRKRQQQKVGTLEKSKTQKRVLVHRSVDSNPANNEKSSELAMNGQALESHQR